MRKSIPFILRDNSIKFGIRDQRLSTYITENENKLLNSEKNFIIMADYSN